MFLTKSFLAALIRGGVQIEGSFFIEGVFTTQNETIKFKPDTQTTISPLRYVRKPFLYLESAFDQQMGQTLSLPQKKRQQSHVVLTQFVIVPGLCGKDPFN